MNVYKYIFILFLALALFVEIKSQDSITAFFPVRAVKDSSKELYRTGKITSASEDPLALSLSRQERSVQRVGSTSA